MWSSFVKPIDSDLQNYVYDLPIQTLGKQILLHTYNEQPNLDQVQVALLGVLDNRFYGDKPVYLGNFRKELYKLYTGNWHFTMADLGDIAQGENFSDTEFALKNVVSQLLSKQINVIVIGGSQELTYALYTAFPEEKKQINVVSIDKRFDVKATHSNIVEPTYISRMIVDQPCRLDNFGVLGYQSYYIAQEEIDLFEKLYFEVYRLGELVKNIEQAEPLLRNADCISMDLTSISSSASGNWEVFSPNGFNGREICALARYSGISEKNSIFGMFQHNNSKAEAVLMAQVLWYYLEGLHLRVNEYPNDTHTFAKYIVPLEEGELYFYKSLETERWWMDINNFWSGYTKPHKIPLLPCSYQDYLEATQNEIPAKCWKTIKKMI